MKILLVNPNLKDGRGFLSYTDGRFKRLLVNPSMTLAYLAALVPPDHEITIWDESLGDKIDYDFACDLVGISTVTQMAREAYEIADEFRRRGKRVVLGGVHPTLVPDEAKAHADSVVIGEAEYSWPELIGDLQAGRQLRPFYRSEKLFDMIGQPWPRWDLLNKQYNYFGIKIGQIKLTRGCPYRCTFCSVPILNGPRFRYRPIKEVIAEMEAFDARIFYFLEDNVVGNHPYARQLFREMIPLRKEWVSISAVTIAYDEELLKLAARSGCKELLFGIETLSVDSLKSTKKFHNLKHDMREVIRRMHDHGIMITGAFVIGFDTDDKTIFEKIVEFVQDSRIDIAQYYILTPFPGAPIYEQFKREGRLFREDWWLGDFYSQQVLYKPNLLTIEELSEGLIYLAKHTYSIPAIAHRLFGRGLFDFPRVTLSQRLSAAAFNLAYREVYREQEQLYAIKIKTSQAPPVELGTNAAIS